VLYLHGRKREFVIGTGLKDRCDEFTPSLALLSEFGESGKRPYDGIVSMTVREELKFKVAHYP
jgi:hypothetical protein